MVTETRNKFRKGPWLLTIAVLLILSLISGVAHVSAQAGANPVTVTVSNTENAPQAGLTVYAFSGTTYVGLNGVTDALGQVTFNLADGSYNFRADLNGTRFYSGGDSGVDTCTVPGCTDAAITVTSPVTVTVVNTDGILQEGLNVYAYNGTTYASKTGVTDVNGEVSFTLLPGDYNFRADLNGTRFYSGGASGIDTCSIPSVGLNCIADTVEVTVPVTVTVSNTSGDPQEGVTVYAFAGTTYSGKTAVTDVNGEVSFTLVPGDYNFRADFNGTQFFSGGASGSNTCTVPGCTADSVTVTSPVVVTVTDTGGTPQANVPVYAFSGTNYNGKTGTTDANGEVSFTLLPGSYNFRADYNGTQFFSGGASGVDTCNIPTTGVDCVADSVEVTGGIVVTVTDTTGAPQEGLNVYAFSGTTYSGKTGITNAAGEVTFTLVPGDYNFRADLNSTQFYSGGSSGVDTCTVPGCTTDSVTVTTPVVVTVSDTDTALLEGLNVYAFSGTTYTGKSGVTDVAGQASFTLIPGDYNFRADMNGYQFFSGGDSGVDTCSIPASGVQTCVTDSVTIPLFGLVDVTVTDAGALVANQVVYLFNGAGDTYLGRNSTTDANGVATFNVPAGDYLFATDLGGARHWSTATCSVPGCTTAEILANYVPPTTLPASTCNLVGTTRTCEFWAKEGTLTLVDGTAVPIWGFADSETGPAQLPGPMIIANEGETIEVIFHNAMASETVAMLFGGQAMAPDLDGVAPGGTTTYSFTAVAPGTFHYEAGLTPNGARQVAMGLYGALIVRPVTNPTGQAYDVATSDTSYDDEALLLFSEIDPDFHADPNNFDMVQYAPKYWLINGQSYNAADMVATTPGNTVLLRYVNAGLQEHTVGIMGLHQAVISTDGQPYQHAKNSVVRTLAAGESADALVTIPATAVADSRYAIYNAGMQQLHNNGQGSSGGILTFLEVTGGTAPQNGGPLVNSVAVNPDVSPGTAPVDLLVDMSATNGANLTAWEYFFNGDDTNPTQITLGTAVPTASEVASISETVLATLPPGDVTIYVRAQDDTGTWGPVNSTVLDLIIAGPTISGMSLQTSPANGTKAVTVRATADERPVGIIDVVDAEYFIDTPGADGTGIPMTLNRQAPVVSLSAQIDAATIQGLAEGDYTIYIHALDALGNWGGYGTIDLQIDKSGPIASGISLAPNPNNGTLTVNSSSSGVRMEVQLMDANGSNVVNAEGFIDYVDANTNPDGSGFPLIAKDAKYDSPLENAYFIIPLATVRNLSEGDHIISFHGLDAAGNWGDLGTMTLTIDKTGPTISALAATPNPITRRRIQPLVLTAEATDGVATIVAAEWFEGTDPGLGQGSPMPAADGTFNQSSESLEEVINVSRWSFGDHTVSVRAKDASGNWGPVSTITVRIQRGNQVNSLFADGFETANFTGWDTAVGAVEIGGAAAILADGIDGIAAANSDLAMLASMGKGPAYLSAQIPADNNLTGYKISFVFSPNGADTGDEEEQIFAARDSNGNSIFGIFFEQGPDGPEVQAWALETGGIMTMTEGVHIGEGLQTLELSWKSGDGAELVLSVDGVEQATLSGLDTSLYKLDRVQLGAVAGTSDTASGALYFDTFEVTSAMYTYFLPIVFTNN